MRRPFLFILSIVMLAALVSCGTDQSAAVEGKDTLKSDTLNSLNKKVLQYSYGSQLFKIDLMDFKLNREDLPFLFDEEWLKQNRIKTVEMSMNMNEDQGKFKWVDHFKWEISTNGQIISEEKISGGKAVNAIKRFYENNLLSKVVIENPGEKIGSSIKQIRFVYEKGRKVRVIDEMENGDSVVTRFNYENDVLISKLTENGKDFSTLVVFDYLDGLPIKMDYYEGIIRNSEKRSAIYTYRFTKEGKVLYGDHWYPGKSNDSFQFEFDEENRLKEITYKIFLLKENLKIPGKTKSYRYEYEDGKLTRINYFMQATDFVQLGNFDFTYTYYK